MRWSVVVPLLLVALFGLGLRFGSDKPHRGPRAYAESPSRSQAKRGEQVRNVLWTGKGTGQFFANEKDAENDALRVAGQNMSSEFLRNRTPAIEWVPTAQFLRDEKLKLVKAKSSESHTPEVENAPPLLRVTYEVELTDHALRAIQEHDRHFRVEQRLKHLGLGVAGIVLILGALAGAIRLDDWTKGFIPRPMKIGLVALAVAGAASLWFVV